MRGSKGEDEIVGADLVSARIIPRTCPHQSKPVGETNVGGAEDSAPYTPTLLNIPLYSPIFPPHQKRADTRSAPTNTVGNGIGVKHDVGIYQKGHYRDKGMQPALCGACIQCPYPSFSVPKTPTKYQIVA